MYKTSWSVGLILIAVLGLSRVEADPSSDPRGKQLECKTQYATSSDLRDPIVRIKMSLSDGNPQIVHVGQSGRTFTRADQYNFKSAAWADGQFTWKGTRLKSPNLTMIGQLKPMTDDKKWFSYTESLFDNKSGNKTYEMFSVCSITPDSTAAARLPPEDDKQGPSQQPVMENVAIWSFAIINVFLTTPPTVVDQVGTFATQQVCEANRNIAGNLLGVASDKTHRYYFGLCKQTWVDPNASPPTTVVPPPINRGAEGDLGTFAPGKTPQGVPGLSL